MNNKCDVCGSDMIYGGFNKWKCPFCEKEKNDKVLCANCKKRVATQNWVGEGGVFSFVHGLYQEWCEICCITEQLKYAKQQAEKIPELEKKLEELTALEIGSKKIDEETLNLIKKF